MNDRRIGRFRVAERLLREAVNTGHGQNLFAGIVPLDIERDWLSGTITYIAWHKDFAQIAEGQIAPEYVAIFTAESIEPRWVKAGSQP